MDRKGRLENTGIYQRRVYSPEEMKTLPKEGRRQQMSLPPFAEGDLAEVIESVVFHESLTDEVVDEWGDYVTAVLRAPKNRDQRSEAAEASLALSELRKSLKSDAGAREVAMIIYRLATSMERMRVREVEHFALTGRKKNAKSAKGGKNSRKLSDEQEREVCQLMVAEVGPRVKPTRASVLVFK